MRGSKGWGGVGGIRLLNWMKKKFKGYLSNLWTEKVKRASQLERTACVNTEAWRCEHCYHER